MVCKGIKYECPSHWLIANKLAKEGYYSSVNEVLQSDADLVEASLDYSITMQEVESAYSKLTEN